jgi:hypothetical protein
MPELYPWHIYNFNQGQFIQAQTLDIDEQAIVNNSDQNYKLFSTDGQAMVVQFIDQAHCQKTLGIWNLVDNKIKSLAVDNVNQAFWIKAK